MSDYIEYTPKRHGQRPPYWTPDTPTGLDNKNFVRQPNWAWIAGTVYYVPYEAVHGVPRPAPVDVDADADADAGPVNPQDIIEALQARIAVLEDGLRTIRNYTGEHYGAANTLRLIRMLLGEGDEGASQ